MSVISPEYMEKTCYSKIKCSIYLAKAIVNTKEIIA